MDKETLDRLLNILLRVIERQNNKIVYLQQKSKKEVIEDFIPKRSTGVEDEEI